MSGDKKYGSIKLQILGGKIDMNSPTDTNNLRAPYALFEHRGINKETQVSKLQGDGYTFKFENAHFKVPVLDENDEIVFQLRDFKDQLKSNHDNLVGEFTLQLKDLINQYGETQEHQLIFRAGREKKELVAGVLQILPVFVNEFKKADSEYDQSRTEAQIAEFNRNARLQEQYMVEQRAKMQEAKDSILRMTESMTMADLALPKAPSQAAGRSWPLKVSYQKVEKNIRDFQNQDGFNKNTAKYDGASKKYQTKAHTKTLTTFGDKAYVIDDDALSKVGRKSNLNQSNASAMFDMKRRAPVRGIKYSNYGQNKDQINIDL